MANMNLLVMVNLMTGYLVYTPMYTVTWSWKSCRAVVMGCMGGKGGGGAIAPVGICVQHLCRQVNGFIIVLMSMTSMTRRSVDIQPTTYRRSEV